MSAITTESLPSEPLRDLTQQEIDEYWNNGAMVIRGILPMEWVDTMRIALEEVMDPSKQLGMDFNESSKKGRYFHGMFTWKFNQHYERFVMNSPLPQIAAKAMGSSRVNFFYDQTFVKEPGTVEATPWHQDLPYWPVRGDQVISLWIPFDNVDVDSSVIQYVKGSHKWDKKYKPVPFANHQQEDGENSGIEKFNESLRKWGSYEYPDVPDIDADSGKYELLSWSLGPGDLILHHPLTIHGSRGNSSQDVRRRAIAMRYTGDDAVYWPTGETNFMLDMEHIIGPIGVKKGEKMNGPLFPLVWNR